MIRALGRSAVLLAVGAAAAWLGFEFRPEIARLLNQQSEARIYDDAVRSMVYSPVVSDSLVFPVIPHGSPIRILAHADLGPEVTRGPEVKIPFSLAARFLDDSGKVLARREYDLEGKLPEYVDRLTGEPVVRRFYEKGDRQPTSVQILVIEAPAGTEKVALQGLAGDDRVRGIHLRVYQRENPSQTSPEVLWRRLSARQKENLARGNVFPPEFLSAWEKKNILLNRWRAVGPEGVEGADYRISRLYTRDLETVRRLEEDVLPPGRYADEDLRIVVPIPKPGGPVNLAMTALEGSAADIPVRVAWYGESIFQRARLDVRTNSEGVARLSLGAGLIVASVPRPVVYRVFMGERRELEITPEETRVRLFAAGPTDALEYEIAHDGISDILLRFDVRCPCFGDESGSLDEVAWQVHFLDARGEVAHTMDLRHPVAISNFDRLVEDETLRVTERSQHFFRLPPGIRKVRVIAGQRLLVSAFNRPASMPRRLELPVDYNPAAAEDVRRTWFFLQPASADQRIRDGQAPVIEVRPRPPEDRDEILAGDYLWEDFQPSGDWLGRYLLEPIEPTTPVRVEALGATFTELRTNRVVLLDLRAGPHQQSVAPTLIYRTEVEGRRPFNISVDGERIFDGQVEGRVGELALPAMPVGFHEMRIDAPADVRVLGNYLEPDGRPAFRKRFVLRMTDSDMVFRLDKQTRDEETISATYYAPSRQSRCRITAEVRKAAIGEPGHFAAVTVPRQEFALSPPKGQGPLVLGTRRHIGLAPGQPFFLHLGDDISPGPVQINVRAERSCKDGYLVLARILPGFEEGLRVYRDSIVGGEGDYEVR